MNPLLFPLFIWERLTSWSLWLNAEGTGRADVIGAGVTGLVVALAVAGYMKRDQLRSAFAWIRAHPLWTTAVAAPVAALLLICLSKFATFIGSTLTVVGLLIALDNNRRSHDREEKRFERQATAARAALALELSSVHDYCKAVVAEWSKLSIGTRARKIKNDMEALNFPTPPPTAAETFKEMITSTRDRAVSDRCASILSFLQLVSANIRKLSEYDALYSQSSIEQEKLRAAMLYSLTSTLYDFSRNKHITVRDFDWHRMDLTTGVIIDGDVSFGQFYRKMKEIYQDHPFEIFSIETEISKVGP